MLVGVRFDWSKQSRQELPSGIISYQAAHVGLFLTVFLPFLTVFGHQEKPWV
jgi:hypothetical protein